MYSLSTLNEVFEPGYFPTLVYSAKQEYGKQRHDRPMHKHDSLCELLLCYRGFGTYQVESHSYTIQRGSVIFGNVGELHEVVSDYETEIGTYCFGIQNVYFRGLPLNTLIPEGSSTCATAAACSRCLNRCASRLTGFTPGMYRNG